MGLSLVYITFQLPFGVFVMRNTFDYPTRTGRGGIARRLHDANDANDAIPRSADPRSAWDRDSRHLCVLNAWNEFLAALIFMSKADKFTMPILLTEIHSGLFGSLDWGALQVGITVTILPCFILFLLLQRYYMQGLTGGAVKG